MIGFFLASRAPAKVNLALHVLGRRDDGLHELESLVAFAGTSDELRFVPQAPLGITVSGPTAEDSGKPENNLVLKAATALLMRRPALDVGRFDLVKRLPAAAGIGGGSSDAAAALRLIARFNGLRYDHPDVIAAAAETGADVPVCLSPRARVMAGTGERLGPALRLPKLFAVLVNPRVPAPTGAVFQALGMTQGERRAGAALPSFAETGGFEDVVDLLRTARNDLESAAVLVAPIIAEALERVGRTAECRLARMSGSGATVFGLYPDCKAAARAAAALAQARPDWWIKPTVLR